MKTALIAEDEALFSLEVAGILEDEGYAVVEVTTAAAALERLDASVSLLVTDVRMPGTMDGIALANEVARRRPDVAMVVVSARTNPAPGALPDGTPFVSRPFTENRIRLAVRASVAEKVPDPEA